MMSIKSQAIPATFVDMAAIFYVTVKQR